METKNYLALRRDTVSGVIEKDETSCHFSEWWSGDGIDFSFGENKTVSLHIDELHAIVVAASLMGMVEREEVREDVKRLKDSWINWVDHLNKIKNTEV